MRHHARFLTAISALFLISEPSFAVPVYLKPESRFATGNQPRSWLQSRTREVQFQRWLRVKTKDKAYGWMAEEHVLSALRLVGQVSLTEATRARSSPKMEAIFGQPVLEKDSKALVLEIDGSWARLQPLPAGESKQAWVPTDKLKPIFEGAAQKAFVYHTTSLRVDGRPGARTIETLDEGAFVHVLKETPEWVEVLHGGSQGFVSKADVWRASDLGEKGVRPMFALAPLRSSPLPYANLVRSLPMTMSLEVLNSKSLRWGQVSMKDIGEAWWPMSDEEAETSSKVARTSGGQDKIKTAELFTRKIFDMATSKAVPNLKFASADGIFRTTDGETWTRVDIFKDQNYPISVANSGAIFIGPYVSDDHGETFEQWIRWDSLVFALSGTTETELGITPKNLRIIEIKPEDSSGRRVTLKLGFDGDKPAIVSTDDQGISWKRF